MGVNHYPLELRGKVLTWLAFWESWREATERVSRQGESENLLTFLRTVLPLWKGFGIITRHFRITNIQSHY